MHIRFIASFVFFLITPLLSYGQQAPPQGGETKTGDTKTEDELAFVKGDIRVRCLSTFLFRKEEVYYVKLNDDYVELDLLGENISSAFPIRGSRVFALYNKIRDKDDNVIYNPVVQLDLAVPGKDFLVVLKRNGKQGLSAKAHDLGSDEFQPNNIYVFNESSVPLGVTLEDDRALIKPTKIRAGQTFSHKLKKMGRNEYASLSVLVFDSKKGEYKTMQFKRLRLLPGRRMMFFCYASKTRVKMGATPIRMYAIQDMP